MESVLGSWVTGDGQVQYTPAGLAWAQDWGSLRMTANAAFLAVVYAKQIARALLRHKRSLMHGMSSDSRKLLQHQVVLDTQTRFTSCSTGLAITAIGMHLKPQVLPLNRNRLKIPCQHTLSAGYTLHRYIVPPSSAT